MGGGGGGNGEGRDQEKNLLRRGDQEKIVLKGGIKNFYSTASKKKGTGTFDAAIRTSLHFSQR